MLGQLDHLGRPRLRVLAADGATAEARIEGPDTVTLAGLDVTLEETPDGWSWSVVNDGRNDLAVDAIALAWDAGAAGRLPRFFRNGYQSWSPSGVALLGEDEDPSRAEGSTWLSRAVHHADVSVAPPGELRSELVTVLARDGDAPLLCVGFLGGAHHDGTIRARLVDGRVELAAEAFLGGAVLRPGERRRLHQVALTHGDAGSAPDLLAAWAGAAGVEGGARTGAPYQSGWCSWYQYFAELTEAHVRDNLARADADGWPFAVFQVDDGYQAAIGDWLTTNERFPRGVEALASTIAASGRTPGIWTAPFLVAPGSAVAEEHPGWIARHRSGEPLVGMVSPHWGGAVHVLDTTNPEVLDHLEATAAALAAMGFTYQKHDFTYAPSLPGTYAEVSRTPAERVRAGMEALRRGSGQGAFLLGCGLPLGAGVGVVDGMRIGPDVAPWWEVQTDQWSPPGYEDAQPSTRNAWRNTLTRSFCHRRLWMNDPDCLMLRAAGTRLSPDAVRAWAHAVAVSGGMALVSDDLALLDRSSRQLLDEVVALGREADEHARAAAPPRCDDVMADPLPCLLGAGDLRLVADLSVPRASVERSSSTPT